MIAILVGVLSLLTQVIIMLVIVQFVVGLLFAFNVINPHNEFAGALYRTCNMLLDPLLRPIQRIMPDTRPLDLSPMVLIIGLSILQNVLIRAASQAM
ncbi:MAG: YggT family protein [Novosphingobium sp.]